MYVSYVCMHGMRAGRMYVKCMYVNFATDIACLRILRIDHISSLYTSERFGNEEHK